MLKSAIGLFRNGSYYISSSFPKQKIICLFFLLFSRFTFARISYPLTTRLPSPFNCSNIIIMVDMLEILISNGKK